MPAMNANVSSGADLRLEQKGTAQEAVALLRTAATALLSAADIWSTNTVVAAKAEAKPEAEVTAQVEMPTQLQMPVVADQTDKASADEAATPGLCEAEI